MTSRDHALIAARLAADLARRDASDMNLRMAREAVTTALRLSPQWRVDGPGYNPNRANNGQFGSGPHAARPGAGVHPTAAPHVVAVRAAIGEAKIVAARARKSPTPENIQAARSATGKATRAAGKAGLVKDASAHAASASGKANASGAKTDHKAAAEAHEHAARAHAVVAGSAKKTAAAKEASDHAINATGKAHQTGEAGDHRTAILAHERAARANRIAGDHKAAADHDLNAASHLKHAETADALKREPTKVDSGLERLQNAERSKPRSDGELIDAIGNGGKRDERGNLTDLTPEAQAAVRDHFVGLVHQTGATPRGGNREGDHKLITRSVDEMGIASGVHHLDTGIIDVNAKALAHLGQHAQDRAYDPAQARRALEMDNYHDRGLVAYGVMTHETLHGFGPHLNYSESDKARWQLAEEMSTEMAARHITAQVHGFEAHKMQGGGYDDIMREAVGHAADVTGVSHERAFAAVSEAALAFKRQRGIVSPDFALSHMANHVARSLGQEHMDFELSARWGALADDMNRRYPWP